MRGWFRGFLSRSVLVCVVLTSASDVLAFGLETHRSLNGRAADVSKIDQHLKEQLGFREGLKEEVNGRTIRDWIREGGAAEDRFLGVAPLGALVRSRHHFHNPLLPWDQAGLSVLSGQASVRWAQNPDQGVSGKAAWADARQAFYDALTRPAKGERDRRSADTFRILGQQMHLVADLAVPSHTRNDVHILGDGFEAWAERNRAAAQALIAEPPIRPSPEIFKVGVPIPDPVATVPVARLWDSDQYSNNPGVTLNPTIGLAEYSNANFFSDDTVFSLVFPFPAATSVELGAPESEPKRGEPRKYFKKVRDGEMVDHLAVPGALYNFLPDALKDKNKSLDDKVFQDYAKRLMPRAVGYSAALLDYFFRGSLTVDELFWDEDGVYILLQNDTDETMAGRFELYAIHGRDIEGEERELLAVLDLDDGGVTELGGARFFRITVPETARATADYILVFRGRLGDEEDVVVGRVFMVPHALVIQRDYRAEVSSVCGRRERIFPLFPVPGFKITQIEEEAALRCEWELTNHELSGEIVTNSRQPIIQRIEARWDGQELAPLTLDGRTYAGVWQREGTEPDPRAFGITDPAFRDRPFLELTIDLIGGRKIRTDLVTFLGAGSAHVKEIWVYDPLGDDETFLVTSGRGISLFLPSGFPPFRATSISGHPNPTDTTTPREFQGMLIREGVVVDRDVFDEQTIDDFIILPPGSVLSEARERFRAIGPLEDPQTGKGPFITWQADVERVYDPSELEFLRAVMMANPPRFSVSLRGTQR
jgi:hypothetical protein